MKWVTWEHVGVDRMACAWLIRRYIDPEAQFVFVPEGHQLASADDAQPFDIPGVGYTHRRGHSTFHTLLDEFHLDDLVLARIARMVDEADVVQEASLEPAAAGLDLICRGLRRISPDDRTALDRGGLIYDAIYAELACGGSA
jgi:hypothetical protein